MLKTARRDTTGGQFKSMVCSGYEAKAPRGSSLIGGSVVRQNELGHRRQRVHVCVLSNVKVCIQVHTHHIRENEDDAQDCSAFGKAVASVAVAPADWEDPESFKADSAAARSGPQTVASSSRRPNRLSTWS
mmetsp:Transcript_2706/g.6773  ORF Transcript_2706/g.6773 Transcript_2706/m.6773 type:complete len:131 (-) Transcript_2706:750-1142(-)